MKLVVATVVLALALTATADHPVHCVTSDFLGTWTFNVEQGDGAFYDCSEDLSVDRTLSITFEREAVCSVDGDDACWWTVIYDQGVEFRHDGKVYFFFFDFADGESFCQASKPGQGWVRDAVAEDQPSTFATNWGCIQGTMDGAASLGGRVARAVSHRHSAPSSRRVAIDAPLDSDAIIAEVNSAGSTWTARAYPKEQLETIQASLAMTAQDTSFRDFGECDTTWDEASYTEPKRENLPEEWDWSDVDGKSFASSPRDQGGCGSCWTFGATGMLTDRLKISTDGADDTAISPQSVVSCTLGNFGQGCQGGMKYLAVAYANSRGIASESCFPYVSGSGEQPPCSDQCDDEPLYRVTKYRFVGRGFYGGGSELDMMESLVNDGPIVVDFMVTPDFLHYSGGIYQDNGVNGPEWEEVNHSVVVIGYGEEDGVPFWRVRNSWGSHWGEDGYFRIIRGQDELAIEFSSVEAWISATE